MSTLLIVGAGLFGSLAAAHARSKGIEVLIFDAGREGSASPAAAGLFQEAWAGRKLAEHFRHGLEMLERHFEVRHIGLARDDGDIETLLFVPPAAILEPEPIREPVTAVGDGWVKAGGRRYDGWVYIAAGIWCAELVAGVDVYGKSGSAFLFHGERPGRVHRLGSSRQAIAFARDPGITYFADGTAERIYTPAQDRQTLAHAAALGLTEEPARRLWGQRPYVPGGPLFAKFGARSWVATGGRKMGTILGASFARRLVEQELRPDLKA